MHPCMDLRRGGPRIPLLPSAMEISDHKSHLPCGNVPNGKLPGLQVTCQHTTSIIATRSGVRRPGSSPAWRETRSPPALGDSHTQIRHWRAAQLDAHAERNQIHGALRDGRTVTTLMTSGSQ